MKLGAADGAGREHQAQAGDMAHSRLKVAGKIVSFRAY